MAPVGLDWLAGLPPMKSSSPVRHASGTAGTARNRNTIRRRRRPGRSVRISKEITEFVSGKSETYRWEQPKVSEALTAEQKEILEKRGVLSPAEVHRLASKTKKAMNLEKQERAACHSDVADRDKAETLQAVAIDPATLEPLEDRQTP